MYWLYMTLGIIGFLVLLVWVARVIYMHDTDPNKKLKKRTVYDNIRCARTNGTGAD
jgi:hypothetical protein